MTMTLESLLDGLTDPQRAAVTHTDGPVLVLAGPGSGKTTVVTRRVANLIAQGIPPWQILALTFTNKAAGEMRERIERMIPDDLPGRRGLTIATFHSFCARLLRRYGPEAGIADRFSIYDSGDQRDAIKKAIKQSELSERNFTPGAIGSAISNAKNRLLDAAAYTAEAHDFYTRSIARAYTSYEKILKANDAVDFDDLLVITAKLLRSGGLATTELRARFQYLLIDEYQDTNHAQFVIANALAEEHRNIYVVGDPDQSIYGWRGADIRNILEFEQQYPEAQVIPLGQNFRSTAHIVAAADTLIQHNKQRKHKPLSTELGDGEKLQVITCRDERGEAELIVETFRNHREERDVAWKDMAILYRMNALSRVLEESFRDAQVPYVIARGTAFYERKEIKDALSYLRLVANPSDEVALRRIINTPTRGIGKTSLDRMETHALRRGIRLFDALHEASDVNGISKRAASAIGGFVKMVDGWRQSTGDAVPLGGSNMFADEEGKQATNASSEQLAQLVERIVRESGLEQMYRSSKSEEDFERVENLEELINAAAQFTPANESLAPEAIAPASSEDREAGQFQGQISGGGLIDLLGAYLESIALVSDADAIDPARGAVTLMTLHAAKGLEFEVVAMVGLEDGLLPHMRASESDRDLEEERRLCFVGITRAKRHLMLTRAAVRTHRGLRERTISSQFLDELPQDAIIETDHTGEDAFDPFVDDDAFGGGRNMRFTGGGPGLLQGTFRANSGGGRSLLESFPRGCLVRHPTFGLGRVEVVTPRPAGSSARVNFDKIGVKTLILEYARLERVDAE